ncbi:MAG: undecaprenyldiphospho-muramoylpentapeptide beta-N-acetylglucosaminyltransferase [Clostridia bacterium]|nr:undecaprenyldiphospho-muramoylpentapeptide beta-N-acetylglucosaminyltransferase [Clostridia bacterium]
MKKGVILLTGGGTAGHVNPNLALLNGLRAEGYEIHYAGTADGIERELVKNAGGIEYHVISSGKFRRYFSLQIFTDPFKVLKGVFQAKKLVKTLKPDVVFSKGGFVSVPVVMGAHKKAPVVIHESDYTPGLANKIAMRYADKVCVTFEDTLSHVGSKGVHTGTPVRAALYEGKAQRGLQLAGFDGKKPVLLIMGGSLGAQAVNDAVHASLDKLTAKFDIIHLCGKGKLDEKYADVPGYKQFEYLSAELPDALAATDIVLSRAGANAVFEFLALAKPAVLVPLPLSASRGDQILNAKYFARKGYAAMLEQETLTPETLVAALDKIYEERLAYISRMSSDPLADGTDEVLAVIREAAKKA